MKPGDAKVDGICETLYEQLGNAGFDVLYDDRDERAGAKFAAFDLIGLPYQIIVGPRGVADGTVEIKHRADGTRETLPPEAVVARLESGARATGV